MTHGKNKRNFLVINAEEFIAAITRHIPEKSFQMSRYYGFYSNRARGERRKKKQQAKELDTTATPGEVEVIDVSSYKPCRIPSKTWRDCIKKYRRRESVRHPTLLRSLLTRKQSRMNPLMMAGPVMRNHLSQ